MFLNLKQISGVSPHVNPESQKSSRHDWEEDGDQDVHEEGEEGPGDEDDAHDDDGEHVLQQFKIFLLIFLRFAPLWLPLFSPLFLSNCIAATFHPVFWCLPGLEPTTS